MSSAPILSAQPTLSPEVVNKTGLAVLALIPVACEKLRADRGGKR